MPNRQRLLGRDLEARLEDRHAVYADRGEAYITRAGTVARPIPAGKGGAIRWVPQKSLPDYIGCAGGWLIMFDAKTTSAERWYPSARAKRQAEVMGAFAAVGAVCFFLVEHRPSDRIYLARVGAAGTIGRLDLCPAGVRPAYENAPGARVLVMEPPEALSLDWLRVVRHWWLDFACNLREAQI
jgi:penicillin-binding protein-related factor A (putative recombinase)